MSGFAGFPRETLTFLQELNKNNFKAWLEDHRSDYQEYYLAPALALIENLAPIVRKLDPPHKAEARQNGSLRRIYRDTRFSKDKSPYQPRIHLVFWTGDHPNRSAGIHLVFAHDHFGFGAGHWAFSNDDLRRYRKNISAAGPRGELGKAVQVAERFGCILGKPELARVPRGFSGDETNEEWLRRKGLVARTHDVIGHDDNLFSAEAVEYLVERMRALAPINRWICKYVYT